MLLEVEQASAKVSENFSLTFDVYAIHNPDYDTGRFCGDSYLCVTTATTFASVTVAHAMRFALNFAGRCDIHHSFR